MGLGAGLAQVLGGWKRINCCTSWTNTTAECHYGATKLECLTIFCALRTFRYYLIGAPFEVIMDHNAMQWLKTMKSKTAVLHPGGKS